MLYIFSGVLLALLSIEFVRLNHVTVYSHCSLILQGRGRQTIILWAKSCIYFGGVYSVFLFLLPEVEFLCHRGGIYLTFNFIRYCQTFPKVIVPVYTLTSKMMVSCSISLPALDTVRFLKFLKLKCILKLVTLICGQRCPIEVSVRTLMTNEVKHIGDLFKGSLYSCVFSFMQCWFK